MPRASSHQTLSRQWAILRRLTKRRPGLTAGQLKDFLDGEGFPVTKRTVERDLVDLSAIFHLETSPGSSPVGWRWSDSASADLPGIDLMEAVSLVVVGDLLRQTLPPSLHESLRSRIEEARRKVEALEGNGLADWSQVARYVPPGFPLMPPVLQPDVLQEIEQALLEKRQLRVQYRSPSAVDSREFVMHPVALLAHGNTPYLLASLGEGSQVWQYPLQRFESAELLPDPAWRPAGFSIDEFLDRGDAQFGAGEWIRLEARVSEHLATVLKETPIAPDQQVRLKDGVHWLKVRVRRSWQLHFWILSQGERLTVLRPKSLRDEVRSALQRALSPYEQDTPQ